MKRLISILLVLLLLSGQPTFVSAAAEDPPTPLSDFSYTLDPEAKTVTLKKYTGPGGSIIIDGSYIVDNTAYATLLDSYSVFIGNATITSVIIRNGAGVANQTAAFLFGKCTRLTSVDLSGLNTTGATSLRCLFAYCDALETVNLTGLDTTCVTDMAGLFLDCKKLTSITGYENWNTAAVESVYMAFNQTHSLKTVDLSEWDLGKVSNSGWCFQLCGAEQILLPDSLKTISAGFFNHATNHKGASFTVPAGVERIGYAHTFYDFGTDSFTEFVVPESNTRYKATSGILYSADGRELLAVPRNKAFTNGIYEIPEGVTFLGELCFSRNYNIKTLILPDSLNIQYVELGDPNYIILGDDGNLNAGSNLNIAIYCYTGITAYGVKDTNPNYTSRDGILYSKDMTTVVAIPSRYERHILIPEGVTAWGKDALWASDGSAVTNLMANCTGVSIPASLVSISEDQISKLNSLNRAFDKFSISVSGKNPVYCVDESGDLILRPTPPETTPEDTTPTTTPTETIPPDTTPSTTPIETTPPETVPPTTPTETTTPATTPSTTPPIETSPPETRPPETVPEETVPEETAPPSSGDTDVMPPEVLPGPSVPENTIPTAPEDTQPIASGPDAPADSGNRSTAAILYISVAAVILAIVILVVMQRKKNKHKST